MKMGDLAWKEARANETEAWSHTEGVKRQLGPTHAPAVTKIEIDDFVYLQVERKDRNKHLHKITAVTEGTYRVTDVDSNTIVN